MKIDIKGLGTTPSDFDTSIRAEEIGIEEPLLKLTKDVNVSVQAARHKTKVDVTGEIKTGLQLSCSRCLRPVDTLFDVTFKSVFVVREEFPSEKELELEPEDLDIDILQGEEIDLADIAREQILLEVPEIIICSEDCRGLCEQCGADLNLQKCECGAGDIDPRWAKLKDLKQ